jgi:hypothetical protein
VPPEKSGITTPHNAQQRKKCSLSRYESFR